MKKKIPRMIVISRMKHIDSDLAWHEHGTPEPVTNLGTTCIEPEGEDSGWLNADLDTRDKRDGGEL